MSHKVWVVAKKELRDNLRDRRSLMLALLFPLLGPLTQAGMFSLVGDRIERNKEGIMRVAISGAAHTPALRAHLEENDVTLIAVNDARQAVEQGKTEVGLVVAKDFGDSLQAGLPAEATVIVDEGKRDADAGALRLRALLNAYGARIGAMRLLARGIDPKIMNPLAISEIDVSPGNVGSARLFSTLPFFLVMALFIGGFYVAVDTTSGERERQSLEPLLALPVARRDFALGKLLATWFFTLLSLSVSLAGFYVIINRGAGAHLGSDISLSLGQATAMWLILLPMTAFASSIQMAIASLSKTTKEAQTYIGLLMLVPMAPGMMISTGAFDGVRTALWIPMIGEQIVLDRLLRQQPTALGDVGLLLAASSLLSVFVTMLVIRRFSSHAMV